jgi:transcriptional regulator CtsR
MPRIYFDTPFHELPESYQENADTYQTTNLESLFNCLAIEYESAPEMHKKERTLYFKYYKAWWMGMVRNLYFRDDIHTNNCVLLLTGREQIRKTSHFKYLLPSFLREYIAFTTHGFSGESSVRDVCKLSATNLMIVWDEIEQYLNTETEPNFKKIIDNNDQKIIDKYQVVPMVIRPVAIYGATSNAREFKLGDGGSRRLFHIPVSWVDTSAIMKVNWHKLINDLKLEVTQALNTGKVPWLLEEDELDFQSFLHKKLRSHNAIDIALTEIFESQLELPENYISLPGVKSAQASTEEMMTTKMVVDLLLRYGMAHQNLNRAAVVKALQRLCGGYTRTRRLPKAIDNPRCIITKGQACQAGKHFRWVMPPMRKHVTESMFSMFKNI